MDDVGGVKCVSKVMVASSPGDLEGVGGISEAIEIFPGDFDFPLEVSASKGGITSLDEGFNWLGVNAALILIIANCVNSINSSASQISSSI